MSPPFDLKSFVETRGGTHVIRRILIANNGNAAIKALRSLQEWSLFTFNNANALEFVVMATQHDIQANAEYIGEGNFVVEVPVGPSYKNFSNINLICQIVEEYECDAVWPGWGHGSENYQFPLALKSLSNAPIWIGPSAAAMIALGDKIGSTILAQSLGIPCVPWSGQSIQIDKQHLSEEMTVDTLRRAAVTSAQECAQACASIGLPVIIKASSGGGGKGIRKVFDLDEVEDAYRQVAGEARDALIFVMKFVARCKHLEVQLIADNYDNVRCLGSRDCSVQRRCQKIIEEGPVVAVSDEILQQMEASAEALCQAVGYASAATCEFMYDLDEKKLYFLEVNTRLQVEHVVTEVIQDINIIALQLQVAMGIPLTRMAELQSVSSSRSPYHCIAARITAEDAENNFQPTSGRILELHLRPTAHAWGYFSIGTSGVVQDYADSQIGHVFARGLSRDEARLHLIMALSNLTIRGEIRTNTEALLQILNHEDFITNSTQTTWIETTWMPSKATSQPVGDHDDTGEQETTVYGVLFAAAYEAFLAFKQNEREFLTKIGQGQLPPVLKNTYSTSLVHQRRRFDLNCFFIGQTRIAVQLNQSRCELNLWIINSIASESDANHSTCHDTRCGATTAWFLVSGTPDKKSRRVYYRHDDNGTQITFDNHTMSFTKESDPTQVRAPISGKVSRWLVPSGALVQRGQTYAEIEIMKMYMQLQVNECGTLSHVLAEGAVFKSGDLLATLELPEGYQVSKVEVFNNPCPFMSVAPRIMESVPNSALLKVYAEMKSLLVAAFEGYYCSDEDLKCILGNLIQVTFNHALPFLEIKRTLFLLGSTLPTTLFQILSDIVDKNAVHFLNVSEPSISPTSIQSRNEWAEKNQALFKQLFDSINDYVHCKAQEETLPALMNQLEPLTDVLLRYDGRYLASLIDVINLLFIKYLDVEEKFDELDADASKIILAKRTEYDPSGLAVLARSHQALSQKNTLITLLIKLIRFCPILMAELHQFHDSLQRMANLTKLNYYSISQRAHQLLLSRRQQVSFRERTMRVAESLTDYLERRQPLFASQSGYSPSVGPICFKHPSMSGFSTTPVAAVANSSAVLLLGQHTGSGSKQPHPGGISTGAGTGAAEFFPDSLTQSFVAEVEEVPDDSLFALFSHKTRSLRKFAMEVFILRHFEKWGLHDLRIRCDTESWDMYSSTDAAATQRHQTQQQMRQDMAETALTDAEEPSAAVCPPTSYIPNYDYQFRPFLHSYQAKQVAKPQIVGESGFASTPVKVGSQRLATPTHSVEGRQYDLTHNDTLRLTFLRHPITQETDSHESDSQAEPCSACQKVNTLLASWICSSVLSYDLLLQTCDVISEGRSSFFQVVDPSLGPAHTASAARLPSQMLESKAAVSLLEDRAKNPDRNIHGDIIMTPPPSLSCRGVVKPPVKENLGLDSSSRLHHMLNAFSSVSDDPFGRPFRRSQLMVAMAFPTFENFKVMFEDCLLEYSRLEAYMPTPLPTPDGKVLMIYISAIPTSLSRTVETPNGESESFTSYVMLKQELIRHSDLLEKLNINIVGISFLICDQSHDAASGSGRHSEGSTSLMCDVKPGTEEFSPQKFSVMKTFQNVFDDSPLEDKFSFFDLLLPPVPRHMYFRNLSALPFASSSVDTARVAATPSHPQPKFTEEILLRNVGCSQFSSLDLQRFTNFYLKALPTSTPHIFIFEATPKTASAVKATRLFVRICVQLKSSAVQEEGCSELERYFLAGLNALGLAQTTKGTTKDRLSPSHYMLLSVCVHVPSFQQLAHLKNQDHPQRVSPSAVEAIALNLTRQYALRLANQSVGTIELRYAQKSYTTFDTFVPIRILITNSTNQSFKVQKFVEIADPTTGELIYSALNTHDSLAVSVRPPKQIHGQSSDSEPSHQGQFNVSSKQRDVVYDGMPINTPYPLTNILDEKRALANSLSTVYIYDFLELFEEAIKKHWKSCPKYFVPSFPSTHVELDDLDITSSYSPYRTLSSSSVRQNPSLQTLPPSVTHNTFLPDRVLESVELTLDSLGEVVKTCREMGQNTCGMVAWQLLMRTPEFPKGRKVILIGNDVTFQMGTFGVQEDLLFQRVSEIARKEGVPRIYISVNSGARLGLATEVQECVQVEWVNPEQPALGFKYLFLSEADYKRLAQSVTAEVIQHSDNTKVYKLTTVLGKDAGLGVENLCGSGAIAGETSKAYDSNVTITFVTGRTVGIGAYVTRLGQRVIQKASSAPILLTGFNSLNRVIGRDIYTSNDEIGGIDVMAKNGTTHLVVRDDIQGCEEIIRWLSYIPEHREGALPIMVDPRDPLTRPIRYKAASITEDPRLMITGCTDAKGRWLGGLFDRSSFKEVLVDWAKSVIVGRARLGGIPVGIISVETRVTDALVPADPAMVTSTETKLIRAGQVLFPDSAFKIAQSIADFDREEIPLMILANWRGFSGGQRDMFHEILKFGSFLVDSLVRFKQPCIVYIPPKGELRGGAWVVVDPRINANYMSMYAAPDTRGGVLEPTATVDIKFRSKSLAKLAERLDVNLIRLKQEDCALDRNGVPVDDPRRQHIKEQQERRLSELYPIYKQVAMHFADLHDTPTRMKRTAAISEIVPWERSRYFFYWLLRKQLILFNLRLEIIRANPTYTLAYAEHLIHCWAAESGHVFKPSNSLSAIANMNAQFVNWACHSLVDISRRLAEIRKTHYQDQILSMCKQFPGLLQETIQISNPTADSYSLQSPEVNLLRP